MFNEFARTTKGENINRVRNLAEHLICWLAKFVLSLRYQVRIEGLEEVAGLEKALILPNHPAYMDPPIVLLGIWLGLKPTPLLFAPMFRNPLLFWLPGLLGAVELEPVDRHSVQARRQVETAIQTVADGLKAGKNQILWPAGRAQRRNVESLAGTRSATEILQRVPDANIVLVRTRGLWGSMFSYARTGGPPKLTLCLLKGLGILAANLIFFTPRRAVHVTVRRMDASSLPTPTRDNVNRFLEHWYNDPGPESPTHVPYHRLLGSRHFKFPQPHPTETTDQIKIPSHIRTAVGRMIAEKLGRELGDNERLPQTQLETLGFDSLEQTELALTVEQRFGFTSDTIPLTVGDLERLAEGLARRAPPKPAPKIWHRKSGGTPVSTLLGRTIPEALIHRALVSRRDVTVADDTAGGLTYERFLAGALVMAKRFKTIATPHVGLLMPASAVTDMAFCSLHLAGKCPVLLNWTTGPAGLAQAAELMALEHVITSRQFVDRMDVVVKGTQVMFLEDLRATMSRRELLGELLRLRFARHTVRQRIPSVSADAPAAVLFTSGSERAPKAVPLSHANILSNIRSVLDAYQLSRHDAILGFLPTFHSFGLTMTTLLPILTGCRVVHHPDPTDASALVAKARTYGATIICATPTFLGYILDHAKPRDLETVRLVVVGAETCPPSLFDRLKDLAPRARLLEGYGITECSPLISGNRPDDSKPGSVGPPLPGVKVRAVHPDRFDPEPANVTGLLLVSGPNVFGGYLGPDTPFPFHDHDDQRWYVTGDLGHIDEDGFIFLKGRLKRFLKAGGEMISLPAIEEPFTTLYPPTENGPRVAVEGIETTEENEATERAGGTRNRGRRRIVLFTTEPLSLAEANRTMLNHGFRGVMRLDEVRRVGQIPVLGTGKTDYKQLRQWIEDRREESPDIAPASS